ncbi:Oxidoreductase [Exophiala xenobiotica]|uniref:Mitochondrial intermembrane space import and assembly protein 40 n=1 Tax=Vermiconidia calcicola TaxID=1690605 RepID=A0AAV9QLG5_9PEZI|nr:Oxidoreductase [Exophiala xenobiotica]KAK5538320.1 Oxidoreductase [Chaetothyriales sp. CCFEE 6169]KAK5545066.1 Oxidoreductase [Vermiconidia calcicola]KAK5207871.1 Oxidoreductase [Exophiala xenobiotica]KAK5268422.1 Oxidoreductase [Exophiala xenobiotica]
MFRPTARIALRSAGQSSFAPARIAAGRRFASSTPVNARRSWKSSAVRWGLAGAFIYYYNTSPVFAEQPQHNLLNPNVDAYEDTTGATSIEELTSRRARQAEKNTSVLKSAAESVSSENASTSVSAGQEREPHHASSVAALDAELEEEAQSEGAFNPETGEINWDCPCLGGMAHGPCGPEFREAFSCFVFSTEEPKGMDCIDKFQNMQQCFQRHPDVYKGELEDEEELDAGLEGERQELVNEIAERKRQQREAEPQHRLLEEPTSATSPVKQTKKAAPKSKEQPARSQATSPKGDGKPAAQPGASSKPKPPQEEGKVKIHDDETYSPERENIHEGQESKPFSQPRDKAPDEAAVPESPSAIPSAAHDARGHTGVVPRPDEQ